MSRRDIFDRLQNEFDAVYEMSIITFMFENDNLIVDNAKSNRYYTIEQYVDFYIFDDWHAKGRSYDCDDMKKRLGIGQASNNKSESNKWIDYMEYMINLMALCKKEHGKVSLRQDFYNLEIRINDILEHFMQQVVHDLSRDVEIIIPKDAAVVAAAEIVKDALISPLLQYHHRLLKGDIERKKEILLKLGHDLEARRKVLKTCNDKLADSIFMMLNSMNIRHNNVEPGAKYIEAVAGMNKTELEEWYDELYQMTLIAFLEMDNVERMAKIEGLKRTLERS